MGLADAALVLHDNGYRIVAADNDPAAHELAADISLDAVLLNCHRDMVNSGLPTDNSQQSGHVFFCEILSSSVPVVLASLVGDALSGFSRDLP